MLDSKNVMAWSWNLEFVPVDVQVTTRTTEHLMKAIDSVEAGSADNFGIWNLREIYSF